MKVIFLDVGGVIVHSGTLGKNRGESPNSSFYYLNQIDPACLLRVKRVIDATGAKVVISSTWRRWDAPVTGIRRAFIDAGFNRVELRDILIGSTPFLPSEKREDEITAWLANHPEVDQYFVIDDGPIPGHPQLSNRPNHFEGGFLDVHADEAIQIMNKVQVQPSPA